MRRLNWPSTGFVGSSYPKVLKQVKNETFQSKLAFKITRTRALSYFKYSIFEWTLGYTRWHWIITDWNAEKYFKIVRAKANWEKYSFLISTIFVVHIFRPIFSLVLKYFRRCRITLMHCTGYWFNLLTHFKWDSKLTRAGTIIELLILHKTTKTSFYKVHV